MDLIIESMLKPEAALLSEELKKAGVKFRMEEQPLSGGQHGELSTVIAIVTISVAAIAAIATIEGKRRSRKKVKYRYKAREADGSEKEINWELSSHEEDAAKKEIIEALSKYLP